MTSSAAPAVARPSFFECLNDLPPELILKIYQTYLDSPILEYHDRVRGQTDLSRLHDYLQARCNDSLARLGFGCRFEAKIDIQDHNMGSGFWSPFLTQVDVTVPSAGYVPPLAPSIVRQAAPAIWHIGGPFAARARQYIFGERMRTTFVESPRQPRNQLISTFKQWREQLPLQDACSVRKMHVEFEYTATELLQPQEPARPDPPRVLDIRHHRHPLFKIEVLDEGRCLRVSSLCKLTPELIELVQKRLRTCPMFEKTTIPFACDFRGEDLLDVVEALQDIEMTNRGPVEYSLLRSIRMTRRKTPIFWQVTLGETHADEYKKAIVEEDMGRGVKDVQLDRSKMEELDLATTHNHVVAEMRLPEEFQWTVVGCGRKDRARSQRRY